MINRFEALYPKTSWEKEIGEIISHTKSGDSSQIIGIPGVGRSNLLGLLAYNRGVRIHHFGRDQKKFHFVLMNFSEARSMNLSEILKFYFVSILDSLKERSMDTEYKNIENIFKDSLNINDQQVLIHGLKKSVDYLCLEKGLSLIFLFDRFDEYTPSATPEFFAILRALRNRAKYHFSVVFSMERPIEEVLDKIVFKDFYEFLEGNHVFIPLFNKESIEFRIKYVEEKKNKKIPKDIIDKVLNLTGGHGKLTRFCLDTIAADEKIDNLEDALLENPKVQGSLLDIWKYLTPEEQKSIADNHQLSDFSFLEKVGLIKDGKITIPLLVGFLKTHNKEVTKTTEGKIIFYPELKEIKKGEIVISDTLTSSEFKLLKFLIANEEKIVTRDDIVNAVWGELSSTAGVSEQALDQLIFRVRKKIEDNPNSPNHILTVKGRGFRFLP